MSRCRLRSANCWKMRAANVILASLLFGSAAVAEAHAQSAADSRSRRNVALYARLMAMTDSRTFDAALVDSALASSWGALRAAATLAIGQVGSSHGMPGAPRLRELLSDRDLLVASNAAYALGLLRDSTPVTMFALVAALPGPARVAREAAWALGEIGAPARSVIAAALAAPSSDEARTIQLLFAAAKLKPVPVLGIRRFISADSPASVLWAATYAIARTRAPAGARDLIAAANLQPLARSSAADARAGANARRVRAAAYRGGLCIAGRGSAAHKSGDRARSE